MMTFGQHFWQVSANIFDEFRPKFLTSFGQNETNWRRVNNWQRVNNWRHHRPLLKMSYDLCHDDGHFFAEKKNFSNIFSFGVGDFSYKCLKNCLKNFMTTATFSKILSYVLHDNGQNFYGHGHWVPFVIRTTTWHHVTWLRPQMNHNVFQIKYIPIKSTCYQLNV